ncbi:hypothetical protein DRN48_07590 [Thermococci archaeon]|nr:MAG: hypothetical protein DRN48_07590 [Thermococci archaeon]
MSIKHSKRNPFIKRTSYRKQVIFMNGNILKGFIKNAPQLFEGVREGETVLIEYSPIINSAVILHELILWAKENEYQVVIDDTLDTLAIYKNKMDLKGLNSEVLNDIKVVKIGGTLDVGDVIGHLALKEPHIRVKEYLEVALPHLDSEKRIINPVLGFEKLLILSESSREVFTNLSMILSFVSTFRRTAFYFVNVDALEQAIPWALPLLEEIATTVVELGRVNNGLGFSVKSYGF